MHPEPFVQGVFFQESIFLIRIFASEALTHIAAFSVLFDYFLLITPVFINSLYEQKLGMQQNQWFQVRLIRGI
jgi:hypothetical protein